MAGSGTCRDVCEELGIHCCVMGHPRGLRRLRPNAVPAEACFDFFWAHPPYWRQKLYADDPRDLSRARRSMHFLDRYRLFIRNCARALNPAASWRS